MVGKIHTFIMHQFANKTRQATHRPSRSISHDRERPPKRSVPLIASPLDPKATAWLEKKKEAGNLTLQRRPTIAQFEADRIVGGIFRKQHEATTLELFFDLFFVANLAVFTNNHEHVSAQSVGNYIGFFTILWFTWFHTSIFDVRFYVDSLFNRFCKLVTFGIFTAFTGLGPVYDALYYGEPSRAFHAISLVLMVSRCLLLLQHASVLWFVRPFKKTVLPLSLIMTIYFLSAMGFLATYLDDPTDSVSASLGNKHVIIWYSILAAEALLVIAISSIWRILSFKHTHLVERVGLLSLIIMGEGIIGLTKSVAYLLSGTSISFWHIVGKVVAAVLLIYEVYLLYFSPIDHDRFGTIRQQIWTLLHFPLHVAILLTEEGSAVTLLWDAVMRAHFTLEDALPDFNTPAAGYNSTDAWIKSVNDTLTKVGQDYHYVELEDTYDWTTDLYKMRDVNASIGSDAWNTEASKTLNTVFAYTTDFLFQNFNFEMSKTTESEKDPFKRVQASYDAYQTVYTFFFAASGSILLLLGLMYIIGKKQKSKEEYAAIITRLIVGFGLPCAILAAYLDNRKDGFIYRQSGWIITITMFSFLLVVMIDNHINSYVDRKLSSYDEDEESGGHYEKGNASGSLSARIGPDGHRYGAIHGQHVDAHAAALHFGKPAEFHHHDNHGEEVERNENDIDIDNEHEHERENESDTHPLRPGYESRSGPSRERGLSTTSHQNDESEEITPFVTSTHATPKAHNKNLSQVITSYGGNHTDSTTNSPRRVQLYEPTMISPQVTRNNHYNEA